MIVVFNIIIDRYYGISKNEKTKAQKDIGIRKYFENLNIIYGKCEYN